MTNYTSAWWLQVPQQCSSEFGYVVSAHCHLSQTFSSYPYQDERGCSTPLTALQLLLPRNPVVKSSKPSEQSDAQLFNATHLGTMILKAQVWVSFCCQLYICATTNCSFFCLEVFNFLPASPVFHVARTLPPCTKDTCLEYIKATWNVKKLDGQPEVENFRKWKFSLPDILKHSNSLIWKADVYSTCKMALKILNLLAFQGTAQDFENKQIQIKNVFILLSVDITRWIL